MGDVGSFLLIVEAEEDERESEPPICQDDLDLSSCFAETTDISWSKIGIHGTDRARARLGDWVCESWLISLNYS